MIKRCLKIFLFFRRSVQDLGRKYVYKDCQPGIESMDVQSMSHKVKLKKVKCLIVH